VETEHKIRIIEVAVHQERERLDRYLARQVGDLSRSKIQEMIKLASITINGLPVRASTLINPEDVIRIEYPIPPPQHALPEPILLDIIYEDNYLIALSKPPGMVVHPAHGNREGTLVNALLYHSNSLSQVGGEFRPGIVHRLDKETSGFMIVAKSDAVHHALANQFSKRQVSKEYHAIIWGTFTKTSGIIEAPLGRHPRDRKSFAVVSSGKESQTEYQVLETYDFLSLISLRPRTGRTHQLRVHMAHLQHPIFGDSTYGGRNRRLGSLEPQQRVKAASYLELMPRVALHSRLFKFYHPIYKKTMEIICPWSDDFRKLVETLRNDVYLNRENH
jgi:23S rRNA pseudouridine1911/1915/1917 synthase